MIRRKKRQQEEISRDIATLEAAAIILQAEEPQAEAPGITESFEARGIPNLRANPMATQPPPKERDEQPKRWP